MALQDIIKQKQETLIETFEDLEKGEKGDTYLERRRLIYLAYEAGVNDERLRIEGALPELRKTFTTGGKVYDTEEVGFNHCLAEVKKIINPKE